jgi:hypothetical protein
MDSLYLLFMLTCLLAPVGTLLFLILLRIPAQNRRMASLTCCGDSR